MIWTLADLGDQTGRTFAVTGATSGLGRETALQLALAGGRVILAGRSPEKIKATADAIHRQSPKAELESLVVDLADLASVRRAAARSVRLGAIDVLVNNAGVMATPHQRTADGLDLQMATNHFGPFLFTGLLLPQLVATGAGRVVMVSSAMHHLARSAPLGDPRDASGPYRRWPVYAQTKLANLLTTFELQRRSDAEGLGLQALAAHPGYSATNLLSYGQTMRQGGPLASVFDATARATAQSAAMGALPILMAATADLPGGTFCGPSGFRELRGLPHIVTPSRLARSGNAQRAMWRLSEETVGLRWP
ncbi:oxidoreductase [Nocardioides dubius]|uniref:SDR family NAD(P)-dependent oxidoreductase n=1 Tax=Nocardioides dubius TaxID=317019 RepID=A0ABN1U2V5_9ACTN